MPRRKRQTIAGAIAYVSEVDFPGQTREVSKRLGIIQPKQYHCFADKQSQVECTHQTVPKGRCSSDRVVLLKDRSRRLGERLSSSMPAFRSCPPAGVNSCLRTHGVCLDGQAGAGQQHGCAIDASVV
jgi:hypothetical protein